MTKKPTNPKILTSLLLLITQIAIINLANASNTSNPSDPSPPKNTIQSKEKIRRSDPNDFSNVTSIELHHSIFNLTQTKSSFGTFDLMGLLFGFSPYKKIKLFPDLENQSVVLKAETLNPLNCQKSPSKSFKQLPKLVQESCILIDKNSTKQECSILNITQSRDKDYQRTTGLIGSVVFNHSYVYTKLSNNSKSLISSKMLKICEITPPNINTTELKNDYPNILGLAPSSDFLSYLLEIYDTRYDFIEFQFNDIEDSDYIDNTPSNQTGDKKSGEKVVWSMLLMPDHLSNRQTIFTKEISLKFWGVENSIFFLNRTDNGSKNSTKNTTNTSSSSSLGRSRSSNHKKINEYSQKGVFCFTTRVQTLFIIKNAEKIAQKLSEILCGDKQCYIPEEDIQEFQNYTIGISFQDDLNNTINSNFAIWEIAYKEIVTGEIKFRIEDIEGYHSTGFLNKECDFYVGLSFHKQYPIVFQALGKKNYIIYKKTLKGTDYQEKLTMTAAMALMMLVIFGFTVNQLTWSERKVKEKED